MKVLEWIKDNWFKVLAAAVLFGGLGRHPYSYYEALRWIVSVSAFAGAMISYRAKLSSWTWIYGIMGVLFNPIAPFYLQQSTWQTFDFIAGIIFLIGAIPSKAPVEIKTK